jgi:hypothetical protein
MATPLGLDFHTRRLTDADRCWQMQWLLCSYARHIPITGSHGCSYFAMVCPQNLAEFAPRSPVFPCLQHTPPRHIPEDHNLHCMMWSVRKAVSGQEVFTWLLPALVRSVHCAALCRRHWMRVSRGGGLHLYVSTAVTLTPSPAPP